MTPFHFACIALLVSLAFNFIFYQSRLQWKRECELERRYNDRQRDIINKYQESRQSTDLFSSRESW